jgi:hypothetical protein
MATVANAPLWRELLGLGSSSAGGWCWPLALAVSSRRRWSAC